MVHTPGTRFENMGRRVDERVGSAIPRTEEEIKKASSYLNDEVVSHVRQDSAQALRSAAAQLGKLADRLDANRAGRKLE
ncbi:MAG TPA: hypothetical protein VGM27_07885 [Acidobacteriaceae bacterium]|jgi:hypothetical protein